MALDTHDGSLGQMNESLSWPSVGDHADTANQTAGFSTFNTRSVWVASILIAFVAISRILTPSEKIPPGAKRLPRLPGIPWVGRFWGIPISGAEAAWMFGALHKKYGPLYEWITFGVVHIWIENDKIARDLFVLRGKKYGDRHELPAAVGVRDGSEILPLMGIGEAFTRHKNFIHALMRSSTQTGFLYEYCHTENLHTLRRLLDSPDRWSEHMITHCARTVARCAWGDPRHGTKLLTIVPELLKAVSPDGPLPNVLPFLQHLPAWISPFKRAEAVRKQTMQDAFYAALEDVKTRHNNGTAAPSWARLLVENTASLQKAGLNEHEAAHAIGTNSFVAIATIGSPLHSFMTAMCHYPSWLHKLQAELDTVIGPSRLPTMSDLPQLPLLRAVVKETLRWRQPTPLGVPHITTEADVYNGYYIPAHAMVHANHYLISRDPALYPNGAEFNPARWLDPTSPCYKAPTTEYPTIRGDPGFGYGTRSCTGIDLVTTELYTLVGALAWGFEIRRHEGKRGYENPVPWYETNPFVITMAKGFDCYVAPRSEAHRRFILAGCEDGGELVKVVPGDRLEKARQEVKSRKPQDWGRWDVFRPEGGKFVWERLTEPMGVSEGNVYKAYPPGV